MMLYYKGYSITFQEVPNEVSLTIPIAGCPYRCDGCHSPELWEDNGEDLEKDLPDILKKYADEITCVCFMGSGKDEDCMRRCVLYVRANYPNLKICVYTGSEYLPPYTNYLDYVKIGPYRKDCGGLRSESTNQTMYKVSRHTNLSNITFNFWV